MPADIDPLDLAAFAVFALSWLAYHLLFDGWLRRPHSINALMQRVRRHWMHNLLLRNVRIMDSQLIGHTIHSASFFASTTIVVLAGLIGVLGSADRITAAVTNVTVLLQVDQRLFEWKVGLLIGIFIYAFFKFTWALRQFNYFCAVLGSAHEYSTDNADVEASAAWMADVMTHAVIELNAGVRAYYFAFAALGWFVHPLLFMLSTVFMVLVLVRRQLFSPTARTLRLHADTLDNRSPPALAATNDAIADPLGGGLRGPVDGPAGFR